MRHTTTSFAFCRAARRLFFSRFSGIANREKKHFNDTRRKMANRVAYVHLANEKSQSHLRHRSLLIIKSTTQFCFRAIRLAQLIRRVQTQRDTSTNCPNNKNASQFASSIKHLHSLLSTSDYPRADFFFLINRIINKSLIFVS